MVDCDTEERTVSSLLEEGIEEGKFPGAAAAIGHLDRAPIAVYHGERDPEHNRSLTPETRFDLASLTKPVVTTTIAFQLLEEGRLSFKNQIATYIPALQGTDRGEIPIRTLLTHTSGLQPYAYSPSWDSRETAWEDLLQRDLLITAPGTEYEYSCLNFVHLERVVESVTGKSLATLAERRIFEPVGMAKATMGPPVAEDTPVAVTYDHDHADRRLDGETNDPIARAMGGYSGNAGLFATLGDLSAFAETMLRLGWTSESGTCILSPASVRAMSVEQSRSTDIAQGYGWRTPINGTPTPIWSDNAMGHTGYTGTSLWIDFERQTYAILLTNAVYNRVPDLIEFRERFHSIVAANVSRSGAEQGRE